MLLAGKRGVVGTGQGYEVVWLGLALSYFLLCRTSETWADGNGLVHSELCLTRGDVSFFERPIQLPWTDRKKADREEVCSCASKVDNKRLGAIVMRTRIRHTQK